MADKAHLHRLSQELTDKGKLIEAGWIGLRLAAIPLDAPAIQLEEMRNAFFAGAQHLFSSIMMLLEEGPDATDSDVSRMDLIDRELREFINDYTIRKLPSEGRA